jgi:hypothetical protein
VSERKPQPHHVRAALYPIDSDNTWSSEKSFLGAGERRVTPVNFRSPGTGLSLMYLTMIPEPDLQSHEATASQ